MDDLVDHFVKPFNEGQEHRAYILDRFHAYFDRVEALGITIQEVWVDGSFTTKKPKPGDVDVLLITERIEIQNLSDDQMQEAEELFHPTFKPEVKERYRTDAFLVYTDQHDIIESWKETWGTYRDDVTEKGIARVVLS